jgi:LysR family transcriptional regulator, hydrogen peroxide-inducible genes activator
MTLTELRYLVAVARERHFGRAAERCFVSQPTLSVAIKKLEDELGLTLFERGASDVSVTPEGERIVAQARRVLEESAILKEMAKQGGDPLKGPLRLGAIYTVAPYVLPQLIPVMHKRAPQMPLLIRENFTEQLLPMLREGELDAIMVALPATEPGLVARALYREPFFVAVPAGHPWAKRKEIAAGEVYDESLLLLGAGHCFRDQVLDFCHARKTAGLPQTMEGTSLETIRHMVASGVGITVLPASALAVKGVEHRLLRYIPFRKPAPERVIGLLWRKSFSRPKAIEALIAGVAACELHGVKPV